MIRRCNERRHELSSDFAVIRQISVATERQGRGLVAHSLPAQVAEGNESTRLAGSPGRDAERLLADADPVAERTCVIAHLGRVGGIHGFPHEASVACHEPELRGLLGSSAELQPTAEPKPPLEAAEAVVGQEVSGFGVHWVPRAGNGFQPCRSHPGPLLPALG